MTHAPLRFNDEGTGSIEEASEAGPGMQDFG
jgi:hypothetical protein